MDGNGNEGQAGFAWARERERLLWAVRVRWAVILGFSGLALLLHPLGLFADLEAVIGGAVVGLVTNGVNHACVRRGRHVVAATVLALALDNALITYTSARSGGFHSPLVVMYSVQVVATAMLVTARAALLTAALAATGAGVLVFLEGRGLTGATLLFTPALFAVPQRAARLGALSWSACLAYGLFLLVFVGGFVSERLRRSEVELREKNGRLAKAHERLQQAEAQLIHSEKMRALGQVVAGVAHELNNPISFVSSNIDPLRQYFQRLVEFANWCSPQSTPSEWESRRAALEPVIRDLPLTLDDCAEGARRAKRIVGELRTFARTGGGDVFESVDVNDSLGRTLRVLRHQFRDGRRLDVGLGELPLVPALAGQLDQVFLNLIVNALEALPGAGVVRVRSEHDRAAAVVRVCVSDDGPGIRAEDRDRIFEPFFTTKPVGRGTGLGLSLSYAIVQRHGGSLTVRSTPGEGAHFEVALPVVRAC